MRLIDADALKAYMCSACDNRERCEDRETACSDIADHFYKDCGQPDVQPVKIAKWLEHNGYIYCSNCETEIPTQDRMGEIKMEDVHYCRFCGAKMDGENNDKD